MQPARVPFSCTLHITLQARPQIPSLDEGVVKKLGIVHLESLGPLDVPFEDGLWMLGDPVVYRS
jgi:hypothetical protein